MQRNDHLDTARREIGLAGGVIERVEHRRHHVIYWSLDGHKSIYVVPATSRSVRGTKNIASDIRRFARQLCHSSIQPSVSRI